MPNRLDELAASETEQLVVRPILLAELDFESELVRRWTGVGTLNWNDQTWFGIGDLASVSSVQETMDLRASGMNMQLSGVSPDKISEVAAEPIQGRYATLWIGFSDENFALITDPVVIFKGRMDTSEITDGGDTASITLAVENHLRDLSRARLRRYTQADQQARFPDDKGLEFVPALQEIDIDWGKPKSA